MRDGKRIFIVLVFMSVGMLSGCATILSGSDQTVAIDSVPSEASVVVLDEMGAKVFDSTTPSTVTLKKGKGYFKKKSYTVEIDKDGYQPQVVELTGHANGWYIGGNLLFGGLIGWLIVDPMSGAMYTLSPKAVGTQLHKDRVGRSDLQPNSITVALLADLPPELASSLVRIK